MWQMRSVSVIGIGETKMGSFPDMTLDDYIRQAGSISIEDACIEKKHIQALYMGNFNSSYLCKQSLIGSLACQVLGLRGIPSVRVEGACASGGLAFRQAYMAVASGMYDCVLVGGVEKMTHRTAEEVTEAIASATKFDEEAMAGVTFPSIFGMIASSYMHEYKFTREALAYIPVQSHANACKNPDAQMHKAIDVEKVLSAKQIASPFTIFDCSLVTDGAAFALLHATDNIPEESRRKHPPIEIIGSGHGGDYVSIAQKRSLTTFDATKLAAQEAYMMAGIKPEAVSLAEVHDCFSITQIINTEDLGFFDPGMGGWAAQDGKTAITGTLPINTSGGLKAKGHPIGATGLSQIFEVITQLRYDAGDRQVKHADIGLAHNLGGTAAVCTVHIFKRRR